MNTDENKNTNTNIDTEANDNASAAQDKSTGKDTNASEEMLTLSKAEYDKAIQSAEDRMRTKYSKSIKALEDKVAELTPVAKTDAEVAFEKRLADLERKEKENEAKEKYLGLKTFLQSHNIDTDIADFIAPDVDVDALGTVIEKVISSRMAAEGYKPSGHQSNQPLSKDEYNSMSYDERAELYRRDPEGWKRLKTK